MSKVLVTGGCGFVGSNLVDLLVELDAVDEVVVIDDLSSGKKENCNKKAKYIFADIKDVFRESTDSARRYSAELRGVDVIFHLAANARIQPSFDEPKETIFNNSYGTALICEFARQSDAKVVYAGSSSFYGGVYLNPYAFTKWQGEEICRMYSEVYGLKTATARFFNVYGPRNPLIGQYTPVVAIFEQQTLKGEDLTIVGDGEQRRDFTHVYDICRGLVSISKGAHHGKVFNLGTGTNHSINELADLFGRQKKYLPARPGEARTTLADISKTTKETSWLPTRSLEDYVKNWLKENT
mgnify:CR=1 FL=1